MPYFLHTVSCHSDLKLFLNYRAKITTTIVQFPFPLRFVLPLPYLSKWMTDVFAWAGPRFYAAQHNRTSAFILSSGVINMVSNIPRGHWVVLLVKDCSALSVLSLSACFCSFAHCALWVDLGVMSHSLIYPFPSMVKSFYPLDHRVSRYAVILQCDTTSMKTLVSSFCWATVHDFCNCLPLNL